MNVPQAPMSPEQAARNRRIIVLVTAVFVASCIGVTVWARMVVKGAQAEARLTDSALRSAAWAILCYADANDGSFPTSDAALRAGGPGRAPAGGKPWPSSVDAALGGLPAMDAGEALARIGVTWGPTADVVPNINSKGRPATVGTVDAVNGWLAEYARDRSRSGGTPKEQRSDSK
ncbi:MAG: hypothetical protein ACKOEL_07210 [Planctomycetota bacterium]|jgi:hypothetical protein